MTLRIQQGQFKVFLSALLFSIATLPAYGASNFVHVPLGKGASIEVPKNWVVLSGNQRTTLDTFVEAKGYRKTELLDEQEQNQKKLAMIKNVISKDDYHAMNAQAFDYIDIIDKKKKNRWVETSDLMLTPHYFINNGSPHPPKNGSDSQSASCSMRN